MDISVVICTHNRAENLRTVLQSISILESPPDCSWELIIVDNNSRDHTREVVQGFVQSSTVKTSYIFEKQQGLCYARNAGVKAAIGEIVAFTDDDVTLDKRWLWSIKETFNRFDCIGVGGKIVPVWDCEKPSWLALEGPFKPMDVLVSYDLGSNHCIIEQKHVPPVGANFAFRKVAFEKYGFFRTDLGRMGSSLLLGEDTEFVRRLMSHGETIVYDPHAIVYHPVEEHRLRKSYFQSWYFGYGRSWVRMHGVANGFVCYFGVPRYFLRLFCVQLLKWLFTVGEKERFYQKLQLFQMGGEIVESYYYSKRKMDHNSLTAIV